MFEIVCYNKFGAAFCRFVALTTDIAVLMMVIPEDTFGVLIHDAETGAYIGRA